MATPTPRKFRDWSLERIVTFHFGNDVAASGIDSNFFVADRAYEVTAISEVHTVAGSDGGAVTLQIRRCQGTEAPASGDALLATAFNLKSTANTVVEGTLVATAATRVLAEGDRLGADLTGTLTALAGGVAQVHLRPVEV